MENHETIRKMREMKLLGMADAFAAQLADRLTYDQLPADVRVGTLVDAELDRRQSTRLANLLKGAKLREPGACSEAVPYAEGRGITREEMARHFSCTYVDDSIDIVVTGPTGSGKTWLGCALAVAACRHYRTARYVRLPELLGELAAAGEAGRCRSALGKYLRYGLLVVDEFMPNATTKGETHDAYELVEGRTRVHSTACLSQYQEKGWLERLGGGTSAEGVVGRIANNSYRIRLSGDVNMRRETSPVRGPQCWPATWRTSWMAPTPGTRSARRSPPPSSAAGSSAPTRTSPARPTRARPRSGSRFGARTSTTPRRRPS